MRRTRSCLARSDGRATAASGPSAGQAGQLDKFRGKESGTRGRVHFPFPSAVTHHTYGISAPQPTLSLPDMPDAPTKLQRWLDVVSALASRHFPVSTVDLWREVPSYARGVDGAEQDKQAVRRMFERDKDELKALGIPIETVDRET